MRAFYACAFAGLFLLAACSGANVQHAGGPGSSMAAGTNVVPDVVQRGTKPANWTQFSNPSAYSVQWGIVVAGSPPTMYVANYQGGLMSVSNTGVMKLIHLNYACSTTSTCVYNPGYGMAVGADKKIYMGGQATDYAHSLYIIGIATTTGAMTFKDIPSGDFIGNTGLTEGSDGNIWFVEQRHVAKITPAGTITEYSYPSGATSNGYGGITSGPDGNLWFSEYNNGIIAKIVPSTGHITEYSGLGCNPTSIVSAPDGNLYAACSGSIVQMSTSGTFVKYQNAFGISYLPQALSVGPDGNVWFAEANGDAIGAYNYNNNSFTTYVPPYSTGTSYQGAWGPDGNYWAESNDNHTNVYILNVLGVTPATVTFASTGLKQTLTVKESGTTSWTAKSTSPGVCSVAPGASANLFTVTAAGLGNTKITVADAIGNSFVIPCKVM